MQFAPYSGRTRRGGQLAARGLSKQELQRARRWKSPAFMTYVPEAGEGADAIFTALAKRVVQHVYQAGVMV